MINNLSHINERKTHVISIDVSSKIYSSFEEALKSGNSFKNFINRICLKNDYSCVGIIGVSQRDPNSGYITTNKFGKKEFVITNKNIEDITQPHLHILLVCNPASQLSKIIYDYFLKKHKEKVTWNQISDHYIQRKVNYIMKQSEKIRPVDIFSENLNPLIYDFLENIEINLNQMNDKKPLFNH